MLLFGLLHRRFGSSRLGPGSNPTPRGRCGLCPADTLTDEEIDRRPPGRHVVRIGLRAIGQQLVVIR